MLSSAPWITVQAPKMRWLSFTRPSRILEHNKGEICKVNIKLCWYTYYNILIVTTEHTSGPKMLLRSWIRIQPILHPGTSQRLARPPQDRIGTSLLRGAMEWNLQLGKTWESLELHQWCVMQCIIWIMLSCKLKKSLLFLFFHCYYHCCFLNVCKDLAKIAFFKIMLINKQKSNKMAFFV